MLRLAPGLPDSARRELFLAIETAAGARGLSIEGGGAATGRFTVTRDGGQAVDADREALAALITKPEVERRLLHRVRNKAKLYGQDVDADGRPVPVSPDGTVGEGKIHVESVVAMYEHHIIPLTKEVEVKKQRNKSGSSCTFSKLLVINDSIQDTNRTRLVRKARPVESFFNFFNPPVPPPAEIDEDEADEEELAELDNRLALDYQVGDDFKDRVSISASRHLRQGFELLF